MPLASKRIRSPSKPLSTALPPSPTEDWNCGLEQTRDRRLSTPDGLHLRPDPALHAALRTARHRLAVALRPPLRSGGARLSLDGSLDSGHGTAQPHRAHSHRTHGAVQPIPPPRGPGEDGHDPRSNLGEDGFNSASVAVRSKTCTS